MNSERNIVNKLFEGKYKELEESEFEANGTVYKCVFGRYYKGDEEITRDEYFKAKGEDPGVDSDSKDKEDEITPDFLDKVRNTEEDYWDYAKHKSNKVRQAVASNPNVSSFLLDRLSDDEDPHVVEAVAANPNTERDTLDKIAKSSNYYAHSQILYREWIPMSAVKEIYNNKETREEIRSSAKSILDKNYGKSSDDWVMGRPW